MYDNIIGYQVGLTPESFCPCKYLFEEEWGGGG